jgi:hypothetical protein
MTVVISLVVLPLIGKGSDKAGEALVVIYWSFLAGAALSIFVTVAMFRAMKRRKNASH